MLELNVDKKFLDNFCAFGAKLDYIEESYSRPYTSGSIADSRSTVLPADFGTY